MDQAKRRQRLTELLAILGVPNRVFDRVAARSDRHRRQLEPTNIQRVKGDVVAQALGVKQVFGRDEGVVEDEARSRGALQAHLVLLARDAHAGEILLDQERAELVAVDRRPLPNRSKTRAASTVGQANARARSGFATPERP